jgi:hypothetical protein
MFTQNALLMSRLKKVLIGDQMAVERDSVSQWAELQGLSYDGSKDRRNFSVSGVTAGRPWKMECGSPTRDFIKSKELLARASLHIPEDVSILLMNRSLKESLERRAYSLYTDTLQTTVDQNLPLEMRWLAMYDETCWAGLPKAFWTRYAVVADQVPHASSWLTPNLVELLMSWPEPGPDSEVPFVMMLKRGKAYLRMQYTPADLQTLEHAAVIFTAACDSAVAELSADITL